jgi:hypothetical protein
MRKSFVLSKYRALFKPHVEAERRMWERIRNPPPPRVEPIPEAPRKDRRRRGWADRVRGRRERQLMALEGV